MGSLQRCVQVGYEESEAVILDGSMFIENGNLLANRVLRTAMTRLDGLICEGSEWDLGGRPPDRWALVAQYRTSVSARANRSIHRATQMSSVSR